MLRQTRPWHALIGVALGGLGVTMMAGIFGTTLAQGAVGTVAVDEGVLRALQAMMDMQGPMPVMFLGALTMVGGMILGAGLFFSQVAFRWSGALFL